MERQYTIIEAFGRGGIRARRNESAGFRERFGLKAGSNALKEYKALPIHTGNSSREPVGKALVWQCAHDTARRVNYNPTMRALSTFSATLLVIAIGPLMFASVQLVGAVL